ncbi:MAG: class I SAM-dependent methyltransferase [Bacteroidota bacterium]
MNINNLTSVDSHMIQNKAGYPNKWLQRKIEHLALSAAAAETYDEIYTKSSFATNVYMHYEMEIIEKYVSRAPSHTLALDLGCGTGRGSILLSTHFSHVYGYDFSPEMVHVANDNKLQNNIDNISFKILDIEDNLLPVPDASVAFVNTAFGMGSFVNNADKLIAEVNRVLLPGGIAIFSFYNSKSLINQLSFDWEPAMVVRALDGEDALEVKFADHIYTIAARSYNVNEVKDKLTRAFKDGVLDILTFPTLSALFPQSLFDNSETRQLCHNLDRLIASNLEIAAGSYIIAVCHKSE